MERSSLDKRTLALIQRSLVYGGPSNQTAPGGKSLADFLSTQSSPQPSFASLALLPTKKPKVFVSYHHKRDRLYYEQFRRKFHFEYDVISDNSVEREIDSEDHKYVSGRIRDNYITGSSCTVVLVGAKTWGRKYVDWEISATLDKRHGLIAVRLPTATLDHQGSVVCPGRLCDNIWSDYTPFIEWAEILQQPERLPLVIQDANRREKQLINNARTRRERNEGGD